METLLIIIWIHFIADFVFQTDKMALNKSKSNKWLGIHSLIYSVPFIFFGWQYAVVNGVFHFVIDYMTARGTSKLWNANKRHWFFVLIGLDQAIHVTILIVTFKLFVS